MKSDHLTELQTKLRALQNSQHTIVLTLPKGYEQSKARLGAELNERSELLQHVDDRNYFTTRNFQNFEPVKLATKQLDDVDGYLKYLTGLLFDIQFLDKVTKSPTRITLLKLQSLIPSLTINPTHFPVSNIPIPYEHTAIFAAFYSGRIKFQIRNKNGENVFV